MKRLFWLIFILIFIVIGFNVAKVVFETTLNTTEKFLKNSKHVSYEERYGILFKNEIWSEEIYVTGDLIVPWGVKLEISPGTIVKVAANSDRKNQGGEHIIDEITNADPTASPEFTKSHTGITILGELVAKGTPEEKIIFTSDAENPSHTDWDGLWFQHGSRGEMEHCVVEWVHSGPAVHNTDDVKISNCNIRHVFWGGLHAFESSPIFEYNNLEDIGHEAFDTHKASPIIQFNNISHSRTAFVFNYYNLDSPIIFENNIVKDSSSMGQLQENAKVIIKNNIFRGSRDTGGPWHYKGFTLDNEPESNCLALADNVNVEIVGNDFFGIVGPSICYERIGPNQGIGHTTDVPEPFKIGKNPIKILVKNNSFSKKDEEHLQSLKEDWDNVFLEDNSFQK